MVLRLWQFKVVEYRDNLRRSDIRRTETIATTNDERTVLYVIVSRLNIKVERLTLCTRLLGTVKHGNLLARCRNSSEEVLYRERTIEVNINHADLLTLCHEVVNSFLGSFASRAHEDDNILRILCAIVVEEMVFTTRYLRNLCAILLYYLRYSVIVCIASLTVCEECLWVLGGTACYRALWSECTVAEVFNKLLRSDSLDVLHIHHFNLVVLVRSTEAIKEVDEWHLCLKSSKMRDGGKVHHLLH